MILVTGASGFIGGALTQSLIDRGESVRVLIRPTSDLSPFDEGVLEVVRGSLSDPSAVATALDGVETVFHCAALAADWGPWEDFEEANVSAVQALLDGSVAAGSVQRFLHVSSSDVYGYPRVPVDETYGLHEAGNHYNRSKIMSERLVEACHQETGLPVTIVRPVTVFGPRSYTFTVGLSQLLLEGDLPLLNGGKAHAGLIYIDDLVRAIVEAAANSTAVGQAYTLRDPIDMTWKEAILRLAAGLGVEPRLRTIPTWAGLAVATAMEGWHLLTRREERPLLTRQLVHVMTRDQGYSIDKAQTELGFAPSIGVEAGFDHTIEWLHSPEGQRALKA